MKNTTNRITRTRALELITNTNGKIFTVSFLNKANQQRTINGRIKVAKGSKGGKNYATDLGYLTMWSMQDKGYRNVNKQTMTSLKTNKQVYTIS